MTFEDLKALVVRESVRVRAGRPMRAWEVEQAALAVKEAAEADDLVVGSADFKAWVGSYDCIRRAAEESGFGDAPAPSRTTKLFAGAINPAKAEPLEP